MWILPRNSRRLYFGHSHVVRSKSIKYYYFTMYVLFSICRTLSLPPFHNLVPVFKWLKHHIFLFIQLIPSITLHHTIYIRVMCMLKFLEKNNEEKPHNERIFGIEKVKKSINFTREKFNRISTKEFTHGVETKLHT